MQNERNLQRGSFVFYFVLLAILIFIDQITKYQAFHTDWGMFLNNPRLGLAKQLFYNNQFAFSVPAPVTLIYLVYAIILFFIFRYLWKNFSSLSYYSLISWVLILSGALSNIGERIILGRVKDFIYFRHGIFNLADFYIILGIILLLVYQTWPKSS